MSKILEHVTVSQWFFDKVTLKEKANFYEHLSNMLSGGINIIEAVLSFSQKTDNVFFSKSLQNLAAFIQSGDGMSVGMKKIPGIFKKHEISVVEAGEKSGKIEQVFLSLAEQTEKNFLLISEIRWGMTYPLIIFTFLVLVIGIVIHVVVPQLRPLFDQIQWDLPLSTKILFQLSDFTNNNTWTILIGIILFIFGIYTFISSPTGKNFINTTLLETPLIGKVYKNIILTRIASYLHLLLAGGISILKTFDLISTISNNSTYEKVLKKTSKRIAAGKKVHESLEKMDPEHELFPLDFLQMIASGEKTSTLPQVAEKLSIQYAKETKYALASLLKWIEPIATLIAGIFVAWFALSIVGALMQLNQGII